MATGVKKKTAKPVGHTAKPRAAKPDAAKVKAGSDRALYLYAISRVPSGPLLPIAAEGIDGEAVVEGLVCEGHLCWVSRVSREHFAENLPAQMEDLEWLATAGLRHQRAVAAIAEKFPALPARFGTIFHYQASLANHLQRRKPALGKAFRRIAEADEWGVKVFRVAQQRAAQSSPASGAEYLQRQAEKLKPVKHVIDAELRRFISEMKALSVAAGPGGKASAGQPALEWHGSFLVRRKNRKKLSSTLAKYARKWEGRRRIDCSGPWPPYSFVGDDVN